MEANLAASGDIARAISGIRTELQASLEQGVHEDIRFGLGDVELTLQGTFTEATSGGLNLNFKIFGVGLGGRGDTNSGLQQVQTIKIVLKPSLRQDDGRFVDSSGEVSRGLLVAGRPPEGVSRPGFESDSPGRGL